MDLSGRFWAKVQRSDACWRWTGAIDRGGYGQFWHPGRGRRGQMVLAHRFAYEDKVGPLLHSGLPGAKGEVVMHTCDNRWCVRPEHLVKGTQVDNMADMVRKGRSPVNEGSRNPRAKLSEEQVATIRSSYTGRYGEKSAIARQYGVSTGQVSKILLGHVWAGQP